MNSVSKPLFNFIIFVSFVLLSQISTTAQELKVEDIISKHLDSIGTKEKRAEIKNQFAAGISEFQSKLPNRKTGGKAVIVSDASNLFFVSSFNSKEYPFEKIGYFKNKVTLPFVTAGARSPLGAFIADHSNILSEGLLTGAVSATWTLLDLQNRNGRLDLDGTKKIDGRKAYVIAYFPKATGSADVNIKLFFDAETFQHLRTEYRRTISPRDQTFGTLGTQAGVKMALTESFADFKSAANGLTLPHSYKISYVTDSNSGTYEFVWSFTISQYLFNQKLDANFFTFEEK